MTEQKTLLVPTILCGGAGTRLWPLSRDAYPKQFLSFTGTESMLQSTIHRLSGFTWQDVTLSPTPIVVCNEDHRFLVAEQIKALGHQMASIILEPVGRNTAPALTLAALQAAQPGQDPLLLVMPADHVMKDRDAFHQAIATGIESALSGAIVTFGVVPDRPETGYGYIQADQTPAPVAKAFPISRFVEKPDKSTAEQYLKEGGYYWNSGIFMMKASVWLRAVASLQPEILDASRQAFERGTCCQDFLRVDREMFTACPANSIDYAVMEKLSCDNKTQIQGKMIPLQAGWSDMGAWDAVWANAPQDIAGNAVSGDVILDHSSNSLVLATSRLVSCVGIDHLVVIEAADAVLVASDRHVQDVKNVVGALKARNSRMCIEHRKVYRPWGWYDTLESEKHFQVKHILVNPGASISLQLHQHRSEDWVIVTGTAKVTCGGEILLLSENQTMHIPLGIKHRLENPGQIPLELIEVQYGSYCGEDDIQRFEDLYGRDCEENI